MAGAMVYNYKHWVWYTGISDKPLVINEIKYTVIFHKCSLSEVKPISDNWVYTWVIKPHCSSGPTLSVHCDH